MFKQYLFWILLLSSLRAATQDLLNSGLTQGRFKVGFTVVHSVDLARPAFNNGQHHSKSSPGREMRLAIWYPAATAGTTPMLYKQYVELLLPARNDPAPLRKVFFQSVAELSGDTSLFTNIYAKLIHSKTWSYRDAGIAKGIFPLVIYPGQAHVQSILCEWLASCGFVVVSPAIKGTYSEPAEYNLQGIETGIADMQFALGYMRRHYRVKQEFSLMGTGFDATLALGMQMRNSNAIALVSLEGGITTGFEEALIQRSPYFDLQRCDRSMLIIHSPHRDVQPALTYKYKYAERVYQHYPQSSEFYFLNYGIWEKNLKNIFPKGNKNNTWQSYWYAATSVRHFLHWKLNKDSSSKNNLFSNDWPAAFVQTSYKSASALPPSPGSLMSTINSKGIASVENLYWERKKSDPQPFPFSTFYKVGEQLVQQSAFEQLSAWARLYADAYAGSALPYSMLARAQLEMGETTIAKMNYEKALALLTADQELADGEKLYFKSAIEKRLKNLN